MLRSFLFHLRSTTVLGVATLLFALTVTVRPLAPPAAAANNGWHYINAGAVAGQLQFSDADLQQLATKFGYVIMTKFHAGFQIEAQHDAARKLKTINPAVKVFPYFSMKFWYPQNVRWGGEPINPDWFLKDNLGNIVYRDREADDPEKIAYVDLANPEYRAWAIRVLTSWLAVAPYSGVFFDSTEPVGDNVEVEIVKWEERLGAVRVAAYNQGMKTLLSEAKTLAGTGREIIFNGIAPSRQRGASRNLELLDLTDGATNERFCLDVRGRPHSITADLDLMKNLSSAKKVYMRASYPLGELTGTMERDAHFCLATFLMGWRPGLNFYHFGEDHTDAQISADLDGHDLPIGEPLTPYQAVGSRLFRNFTAGQVHVNIGTVPVSFSAPRGYAIYRRGVPRERLKAGSTVTIQPQDSLFLLKR